MTEGNKERDFLSRWSARKRDVAASEAVEAEKELPLASDIALEADDVDREPTAAELEMQENRETAEAVNIETLDYESDFTLFMKKGVPEALTKRAMRKLWTSNPLLANIDGLNDYDEDYNNPAHNVYKSIWDVARGYLADEDDQPGTKDKLAAVMETLDEGEAEVATPSSTVRLTKPGETVEQVAQLPDEQDTGDDEAVTKEPVDKLSQEDTEIAVEKDENDEVEPTQVRVSMRSRLIE